MQLLQDVAHVVLDGVLGDEQLLGDVAVVHPLGDQRQDLHLAVGQPRGGHLLLLLVLLGHQRELVEQLGGHRGGDQGLAGVHAPDGVGDLVDGDLLQQVPRRPGLDRVVEVLLLIGDRQHEDLGGGDLVLDRLGRLDAGGAGHPHVHQHQVGDVLLGEGDDLLAVVGLGHDVDVGLGFEDHEQAPAEQRVVVGDDHLDGVAGGPCASPRRRGALCVSHAVTLLASFTSAGPP